MKQFRYVSGLPELVTLDKFEKDGKRTYILPNGTHAISVTTMLGHFKKKAIQAWRDRVGHEEANKISAKASSRGTKVHNLLEKYLENVPVKTLTENLMLDLKQNFLDIRADVDRIDNIHHIEASLYSEKMLLAGRTDVIAEFDGTLSIIDFKTSRKEKRKEHIQDYFEQATAYALMYEERTEIVIDQIVIIILADDLPKPQVFIESKENYIETLFDKILTYHRDQKKG
jgi:genome maintenance exonuclease 1